MLTLKARGKRSSHAVDSDEFIVLVLSVRVSTISPISPMGLVIGSGSHALQQR